MNKYLNKTIPSSHLDNQNKKKQRYVKKQISYS